MGIRSQSANVSTLAGAIVETIVTILSVADHPVSEHVLIESGNEQRSVAKCCSDEQ